MVWQRLVAVTTREHRGWGNHVRELDGSLHFNACFFVVTTGFLFVEGLAQLSKTYPNDTVINIVSALLSALLFGLFLRWLIRVVLKILGTYDAIVRGFNWLLFRQ